MASQRQIEANRRNAAGPHKVSEEGKEAVRQNAIRHGLATKRHVVLRGEDQTFYDELLNALLDEYAPANTQEEMLVHQIAEHHWRLLRARNMESAVFEINLIEFAEKYDEDLTKQTPENLAGAMAGGLPRFDGTTSKIQRYETAAERSYYRAIRELAKLQKTRKQESPREIRSVPQKQQNEPAAPEQIRSVPQNDAKPAPAGKPFSIFNLKDEEVLDYLDKKYPYPIR